VRPVSLGMNVTVDGFVAGPAGELDWIYPHIDADLLTVIVASLTEIDTMLMGRVNYEEQAAHWPSQTDPIANLVNNHTKVVFSTTLHAVDWVNSRLATSDPAEEIANLRQQEGGTIGVSGGPTFAAGLLQQGRIDELRLTIHPVALGGGTPLFSAPQKLKLLRSRSFATGAILNTYHPA